MTEIIEKISSMAIVINIKDQTVLMLNNEGEWVFPKGHVETGESYLTTAIRELDEESGIKVTQENSLGQIDEFRFYFDGEKAVKVIKVFLFKIDDEQVIKINKDEGFLDGKWIAIEDSINQLSHDDAKNALLKSLIKLGFIKHKSM